MKDIPKLPFKSDFLNLRPDPLNLPFDDNPCLNIDPRNPDFLTLSRHCPLRIIPGLAVGRRKRPSIARPDLVIAAHQSYASSADEIVHAVTIRNIGDAVADIGPALSNTQADIQFYVSMNPLIDGDWGVDYSAAGGFSFQAQQINPGEEIDILFAAGPGTAPQGFNFTDFNYVIARLFTNPVNDQNTENNLSIVPLLVP